MSDYIINYCSICKTEEANCLCKMCSAWYCWEHHCHHLTVAHESNSYSQRLDDEIYEDKRSRTGEDVIVFSDNNDIPRTNTISYNAQSVAAYSNEQLQQQYDYHRFETRRIRTELERRALFASGVEPRLWKLDSHKREQYQNKKRTRVKCYSKSISANIKILHDSIRYGAITVEQIKAQIKAIQDSK